LEEKPKKNDKKETKGKSCQAEYTEKTTLKKKRAQTVKQKEKGKVEA